MDEISIKIGNRIRQIRHIQGVSQEELALAAGINRSFMGQLERGEKNATVKTIEKVCIVLGVTLHEFFAFEYGIPESRNETNTYIKISSMLKQLDDRQASQLLDIMKKITDFKNS